MVRQGKPGQKPKEVAKPSPVSNIGKIASLKRYSDKEYANSLLHDVVKATAKIIHQHNFKVGTLCEMFPKNANLLGLNVNRGQKILIRLRYHHNDKLFLPLSDIIGTFLHELTHNIHGPHDEKFYSFLEKLQTSYENNQYNGNYIFEEQKLGSNSLNTGYVSLRDKRLKALTPLFKGETRKLGDSSSKSGKALDANSLRDLRLIAIERRIKDSKWCNDTEELPNDFEFDVIEVTDLDERDKENINQAPKEESIKRVRKVSPIGDETDSKNSSKKIKVSNSKLNEINKELIKPLKQELLDVIDLTNEEYDEPNMDVIVIDACAKKMKTERPIDLITQPTFEIDVCTRKSSLKKEKSKSSKPKRRVQFVGLLPSFDDDSKIPEAVSEPEPNVDNDVIKYSISSSPSHFIEGEGIRRKFVAQLNFEQILAKSNIVETTMKKVTTVKTTQKVSKPKIKGKKKPRISKNKQPKPESISEPPELKKVVKTILFSELL